VSDGSLTDTDTTSVTVSDNAPTAVLTGDTPLDEGQAGNYDASGSSSYPDAIVSYEWDWDFDGLTFNPSGDTGAVQTHTWMVGGTYTVAVRVTDDDGSTDIATLTVTVNDISQQVQTIFDLAARPKSGKVQLTWSPVAGAVCYNIYRSQTSGGPYTLIASCHVTDYCTYLDDNVVNGILYYYVVTSISGGIESLYSNEVSARPQARSR
jgi:hypothetical protein